MVILGLTCLFVGVVVGIMCLVALGGRGVAEEKGKEAEREAAEKESEK